jgi:glycosyltransferase involved in cell wall biosynthesis
VSQSTISRREAPIAIEEITESLHRPLDRAVTIVIPAFNEAAHIAEQVREVQRIMETTGWTYDILVIDDGSTDGTAERAQGAGVRVLRRRVNRGYGASLKAGIQATQHPWILITDADGTYPVEHIPSLLDAGEHNAMVVGARTGSSVKIQLARRPAKAFLRWLASYLAGQNLPDINSGLRLMRKDLIQRYEHLLPDGFSFTTTITLASACNGHPVEYIPINYRARLGQSKIRPRHAYDFTLLILRTIVFFNPLKVFIPTGGILFLIGLGKFIYDMTRANLSESAIFLFLSALIIFAVGLLADQNSRLALRR